MNTHVKITHREPADLSRRSFLVGSAAAGLVLGYSASAEYNIVMLPGMVYGKVVTPPVRYGATVKSVDDSAARKVPGFIKAITLDDKTGSTTGWVVAVANTYANAQKAADALKIGYDNGPNAKCPASRCSTKPDGCRASMIPGCFSSRMAIRRRHSVRRRR
jgi:CO/xanthine dehydrogenase Mo-binding subunit